MSQYVGVPSGRKRTQLGLKTPVSSLSFPSTPSPLALSRRPSAGSSASSSSSWELGFSSHSSEMSFACPLTPTTVDGHSPTTPYMPDNHDAWTANELNMGISLQDLGSPWALDQSSSTCAPSAFETASFEAIPYSEAHMPPWEDVAFPIPHASSLTVPSSVYDQKTYGVSRPQALSEYSSPIVERQPSTIEPHQTYSTQKREVSMEADELMSCHGTPSSSFEQDFGSPHTPLSYHSPRTEPRGNRFTVPSTPCKTDMRRSSIRKVQARFGETKPRTWRLQSSVMPASSYKCNWKSCEKKFKRPEHLKRHMTTHTKEKPYVCEGCGKRFSRSDNRKAHYPTHTKVTERAKNPYIPWMTPDGPMADLPSSAEIFTSDA
ncbi:MAG: hypothetical protein M1825_004581 [Sarcosagium campestre]|nr:MAG: hypothetical protein M1825_004581 [Sarcosagium campestre]